MPDRAAVARFWGVVRQLVDPDSPRQFDQTILEDLADAWGALSAAEQHRTLLLVRAAESGLDLIAIGGA